MAKRKMVVWLLLAIICLELFGCGKRGESGQDTATVGESVTADYVAGYWGDVFVRSNGQTYPFVFDEPITQCTGFTLEYQILEIQEGNLDGNFRYEVYVRQTNGKWKSVELFRMDGTEISLEIWFDKIMNIDAVAVVCGKRDKVSYSYTIAVHDVKYA